MDHIGRVHKQQTSQQLVDKVLDMVVWQVLPGINDPMQVCLHELRNNIDVSVACSSFRPE